MPCFEFRYTFDCRCYTRQFLYPALAALTRPVNNIHIEFLLLCFRLQNENRPAYYIFRRRL